MAASPYKITDRRRLFDFKIMVRRGDRHRPRRGLLSLYDKVISFFPDKLPETVSENLSLMTVADLLSMSSGQRPTRPAPA